jgi:hypothetical protein
MTHEYSEWAQATPFEDYVNGYFDIRPQPASAPQFGFWAGFPRLSTTVPRDLQPIERAAVAIVLIGVVTLPLFGCGALALLAANSPMWRGW